MQAHFQSPVHKLLPQLWHDTSSHASDITLTRGCADENGNLPYQGRLPRVLSESEVPNDMPYQRPLERQVGPMCSTGGTRSRWTSVIMSD